MLSKLCPLFIFYGGHIISSDTVFVRMKKSKWSLGMVGEKARHSGAHTALGFHCRHSYGEEERSQFTRAVSVKLDAICE